MKIGLIGRGKAANAIGQMAKRQGLDLTEPAKADVWIDFSRAINVLDTVKKACELQKPLVMGTTGWDKQRPEVETLVIKGNIGFIFAPNFSFGVFHFIRLVDMANKLLQGYTPHLLEIHDITKVDAPSGTALQLEKEALPGVAIEARRVQGALPEHQVTFEGKYETITLTHKTKDRGNYAEGALTAARWIVGKRGFYTLDDVIRSIL